MICKKCHKPAEYKVAISAAFIGSYIIKQIQILYFCKDCIDDKIKPRLKELKHTKFIGITYSYNGIIYYYIYTKEN